MDPRSATRCGAALLTALLLSSTAHAAWLTREDLREDAPYRLSLESLRRDAAVSWTSTAAGVKQDRQRDEGPDPWSFAVSGPAGGAPGALYAAVAVPRATYGGLNLLRYEASHDELGQVCPAVSPVPLPSTLWLLISAAVALTPVLRARRGMSALSIKGGLA